MENISEAEGIPESNVGKKVGLEIWELNQKKYEDGWWNKIFKAGWGD